MRYWFCLLLIGCSCNLKHDQEQTSFVSLQLNNKELLFEGSESDEILCDETSLLIKIVNKKNPCWYVTAAIGEIDINHISYPFTISGIESKPSNKHFSLSVVDTCDIHPLPKEFIAILDDSSFVLTLTGYSNQVLNGTFSGKFQKDSIINDHLQTIEAGVLTNGILRLKISPN